MTHFQDERSKLWAELYALAELERSNGDGRALRVIERFNAHIEKCKNKQLHQDDGA